MENCKDVLIPDTLATGHSQIGKQLYARNFFAKSADAAYDIYKSAYQKYKTSGTSADANAILDVVPIGMSYSEASGEMLKEDEFNARFRQRQKEVQDSTSSESDFSESTYIQQSGLSKDAISAWEMCMLAHSNLQVATHLYACRDQDTVYVQAVVDSGFHLPVKITFPGPPEGIKVLNQDEKFIGRKVYPVQGAQAYPDGFSLAAQVDFYDGNNRVDHSDAFVLKVGPKQLNNLPDFPVVFSVFAPPQGFVSRDDALLVVWHPIQLRQGLRVEETQIRILNLNDLNNLLYSFTWDATDSIAGRASVYPNAQHIQAAQVEIELILSDGTSHVRKSGVFKIKP